MRRRSTRRHIEPDSDLVGQDYVKNVSKAILAKHSSDSESRPPPIGWSCAHCWTMRTPSSIIRAPRMRTGPTGSSPGQMIDWFEAVGYTVDASQTDLTPIVPLPGRRHVILVVNAALLGSSSSGKVDALRRTLNIPITSSSSTPRSRGGQRREQLRRLDLGYTSTYHPTDDEIDDWVDKIIVAE